MRNKLWIAFLLSTICLLLYAYIFDIPILIAFINSPPWFRVPVGKVLVFLGIIP